MCNEEEILRAAKRKITDMLKGDLKHMHRFHMDDLCIVYEIDDTQQTAWIKTIEWSGSAYK
jgi:mRNA-degrading endonuclease RelE of RelBE toxin-antitoxin system